MNTKCENCDSLEAVECFETQWPQEMSGPSREVSIGILCDECFNEHQLNEMDDFDPFEQMSEGDRYDIEQGEIFNDRYQAWRNEY